MNNSYIDDIMKNNTTLTQKQPSLRNIVSQGLISIASNIYKTSIDIIKYLISFLIDKCKERLTKKYENGVIQIKPLGELSDDEIKTVSTIFCNFLYFLITRKRNDLNTFIKTIFEKIEQRMKNPKDGVIFTGKLHIPLNQMLSKKQILLFFKDIIHLLTSKDITFPKINGNMFVISIEYVKEAHSTEPEWNTNDSSEWHTMIEEAKSINVTFEEGLQKQTHRFEEPPVTGPTHRFEEHTVTGRLQLSQEPHGFEEPPVTGRSLFGESTRTGIHRLQFLNTPKTPSISISKPTYPNLER